jgi:hypothetical protein
MLAAASPAPVLLRTSTTNARNRVPLCLRTTDVDSPILVVLPTTAYIRPTCASKAFAEARWLAKSANRHPARGTLAVAQRRAGAVAKPRVEKGVDLGTPGDLTPRAARAREKQFTERCPRGGHALSRGSRRAHKKHARSAQERAHLRRNNSRGRRGLRTRPRERRSRCRTHRGPWVPLHREAELRLSRGCGGGDCNRDAAIRARCRRGAILPGRCNLRWVCARGGRGDRRCAVFAEVGKPRPAARTVVAHPHNLGRSVCCMLLSEIESYGKRWF